MKFFLCAHNIKAGGGATLLLELLNVLPSSEDVTVIINEKFKLPSGIPSNIALLKIRGGLISRVYIDTWLFFNVAREDMVLFLGNYPPLLSLRGCVKVFLQNRFLIDRLPGVKFSSLFRLKVAIQKILFNVCLKNSHVFYVQSTSMARLLEKKMASSGSRPIYITPFIATNLLSSQVIASDRHSNLADFIYPASGDPHKNHKNLIDAWVILAKDGYFPTLIRTVDSNLYPLLASFISKQTTKHGLKITNLGFLGLKDVGVVYSKCRALIFPSLLESFGLPLLEARSFELKILASELDYVRDVVSPDVTFDPLSPLSIARAVKRFLDINERSVQVISPSEFLKTIFG